MTWRRTHTCGSCAGAHWPDRDSQRLGKHSPFFPDQVFVDLRDRYGLTQVVFESDLGEGLPWRPSCVANGFCR